MSQVLHLRYSLDLYAITVYNVMSCYSFRGVFPNPRLTLATLRSA